MLRLILTVVFFSIWLQLNAQADRDAVQYAERITSRDLRSLLEVIASDSLEGRKTGTEGQKKAGAFISNYFSAIGLQKPVEGSHFQTVPLYTQDASEAFISAGRKRLINFKDIVYAGFENIEDNPQLLFVGNDTNFEELELDGKAVVVHKQGAVDYDLAAKLKQQGAKLILLCNTGSQREFDAFAGTVRDRMTSRLRYEKPTPISEMERRI